MLSHLSLIRILLLTLLLLVQWRFREVKCLAKITQLGRVGNRLLSLQATFNELKSNQSLLVGKRHSPRVRAPAKHDPLVCESDLEDGGGVGGEVQEGHQLRVTCVVQVEDSAGARIRIKGKTLKCYPHSNDKAHMCTGVEEMWQNLKFS